MIIRGREQECFSNFAESNILAESVAQPLSVWTLMNAHFAIFAINIQRTMGEGVVTGGYNCPALHTLNSILLVALFRLRNISIVACCVIFSYSSRFPSSQNSYLPPSLLPPLTSVLPPPPPFNAVEPPKYVNDERKRYREIFRKY